MTARSLVSIVLRLWGALWVLGTLINTPGVLVAVAQAGDSQSRRIMVSNVAISLIWLVLGCALFFKHERIAELLFPRLEGEIGIAATSHELQEVGFSLLAIYFGLGAVSRLAGIVYQLAHTPPIDDQSRFSQIADRNPESLITMSTQLLVCVLLFFGSKGLSLFWNRLRGRNQPVSAERADL